MKELGKEFKGKGEVSDYWFNQLRASGYGYIYEISHPNGNRYYEVFERKEQLQSETVLQGIRITHASKVLYPKSKEFGKSAWCTGNLAKAIERFDEINYRCNKVLLSQKPFIKLSI